MGVTDLLFLVCPFLLFLSFLSFWISFIPCFLIYFTLPFVFL